jgi:hypothetical protein
MNHIQKPLLEIAEYHRSETEAREYVKQLATNLGVANFKTKLAKGDVVSISTSGKPLTVNLRKEVRQTRLGGIPPGLQGLFDNSDHLMPPPISLGASGLNLKIGVTIGSFTASIDGAGIHEPPVGALANDLLFYRHQTVIASAEPDLASLARAYRTYLQVSISLVDAFLGHATFALAEVNPKIVEREHFATVKSTAPFAERVDAWCNLWGHSPADFRRTKCWSDLDKLRQERNRYVHPAAPICSLGIDDIVNVLNRCRDGVGGTLEYFRTIANLDPRLSYIQKVKTAPLVSKAR